jgi:hypothetical protein
MLRRRALHYELIDNRTGRTITSFDSLTNSLTYVCSYLTTYPEDQHYVRLIVIERNGSEPDHKVIINLGNDSLATICEDNRLHKELYDTA